MELEPGKASFCGEVFTVAELRRVYEAVWGARLDASNFHRKVTKAVGFLEPTGEQRGSEPGRPLFVCYSTPTAVAPLVAASINFGE